MNKNTCEFVVGRLLEIRVADGYRTVEDINDMIEKIGKRIAGIPPQDKYTIVADWRLVNVMPPDTAARAREMLKNVNERVVRSAILTFPANPTTNLQVVRLIREAENPRRRHFTSTIAMYAWVSEVLSPPEQDRLRVFLAAAPQ